LLKAEPTMIDTFVNHPEEDEFEGGELEAPTLTR
jgi:hypothetical protein